MRVVLEILDGPLVGETLQLEAGQTLTVGRTARSQLMLPHDNFMSGMHFSIELTEEGCVLTDRNSSNGTWINGERVQQRALSSGDQISAGQTRFRIHFETATREATSRESTEMFPIMTDADVTSTTITSTTVISPLMGVRTTSAVELTPQQQAFTNYLKLKPAPLFVLLNGDIETRVGGILKSSTELFQPLADGMAWDGVPAPDVYLAYLPATSTLLPRLVKESWGQHWSLFFTCASPLPELYRHLRQFLVVQSGEGRWFYFRFYDPRLMQTFLPSCSQRELTQFFGPVQSFLLQDLREDNLLLDYSITPQGLGLRTQRL
ncbi:MAG: DUF4123 domain-containing protein [Acidobacteria bacterium]|nr:DUF4123 domain-containing protein [Acidobacteriota bacterium]